jgi:membrane-anchored protein YejM (alkaline phosphatase superfamily)
MKLKITSKIVLLLSFAVIAVSCSAQRKAKKITTTSTANNMAASGKKPNILFILVDDYGWRDIKAYGSDFYETPNMDKLVSQSLKFTQAYSFYNDGYTPCSFKRRWRR